MDRNKKRKPDAVSLDMWAASVPEKKEPEMNGPCDICGESTIIDVSSDGTLSSMVLCSPECASKYTEMYDRVLEPLDVNTDDALPCFDDKLPIDDDFSNELPIMELPKEYDMDARLKAVHAKVGRGYIAAYLTLNPDLPVDEFECRTNPEYVKWVYGKHNAFCKEHNINRRKVGYTAQNIMDFTDLLYSEI